MLLFHVLFLFNGTTMSPFLTWCLEAKPLTGGHWGVCEFTPEITMLI